MGQLTKTTAVIQGILDRIFRRDVSSTITGSQNDVLAGSGNVISQQDSIVAGDSNIVDAFTPKGINAVYSGAFGQSNKVLGYGSFVLGINNLSESLISHAIGTGNVAGGMDSVALGEGCKTGRRQYTVIAHGVDSLHGLGGGNKGFVLISPDEGDVTNFFPDHVVLEDPHRSLQFDMTPYCIFLSDEELGVIYLILKSTYTVGVGTKVWYDSAIDLNKTFILGSSSGYLPLGFGAGKGMIAMGEQSNAYGVGAIACGVGAKAWNMGSVALGYLTKALGFASTAFGSNNIAEGYYSTAMGNEARAKNYGEVALGCGNGKFSEIGDAQSSYKVSKVDALGTDSYLIELFTVEDEKSYICEVQIVGKQYSTTNGMVGESIAYLVKLGIDVGVKKAFATTDVDVANNKITVHEKIKTGTKLRFTSSGVLPAVDSAWLFHNGIGCIAEYIDDTHIRIHSKDNDLLTLLNVGSGTHYYQRWNITCLTKELVHDSFVDDGDIVGDHLSTGIRVEFGFNQYENDKINLLAYGIPTRNLRWVATIKWTQVK